MEEFGGLDYPALAKYGFLLGLALFAAGAGGELLGHALLGSLPEWTNTLLVDMELLGIVVGFFSPIVFGIALPLVE